MLCGYSLTAHADSPTSDHELPIPGSCTFRVVIVQNLLPFLLYQPARRQKCLYPGTRLNNFYDPNKPREHDNRSFMK
eukprot:724058-Rhodomonas_salina.1